MILQVGAVIGGWPTLGILVLDSLAGAWLLKVQSRRAWAQFRAALVEGRWPGDEVAQGALIIVGGTLLVTPGFVTDVVGFLLLIGGTRRLVAAHLRNRVAGGGRGAGGPRRRAGRDQGAVLDVEVVEIRREPGPPPVSEAGPAEPDDPGDGGRGTDDGRGGS